jgi:hypothetical protein
MQPAGHVRPHRRDATTCRFAAPGRRQARTQTHLVILRGGEPRNDARGLARRANSCRSRGRHPRPHEPDPLLVSAGFIGDLRNVVKHKMRMENPSRADGALISHNILIYRRNILTREEQRGCRRGKNSGAENPTLPRISQKYPLHYKVLACIALGERSQDRHSPGAGSSGASVFPAPRPRQAHRGTIRVVALPGRSPVLDRGEAAP